MSTRPNFFIVGAPRCGTTALWTYLRSHPNIFLSPQKEPHYFAGDLRDRNRGSAYRESLDGYLQLFRGTREEHLAVGEASVWYLFAPGSIERILRFNPDARVIAMVRNPVEMAPSLHRKLVVDCQEDVRDFERAWSLQDERQAGRSIPELNTDPCFLQYRAVCGLGSQVAELYRIVPPSQRLVIVFDDFIRDTRAVYGTTLEFLGVPDDGRSEFPRVNEQRELRSRRVAHWARHMPRWEGWIRLKRKLGLPYGSVLRIPRRLYERAAPRRPLAPGFRRTLAREFREEVARLSEVIGRDLRGWCREGGAG